MQYMYVYVEVPNNDPISIFKSLWHNYVVSHSYFMVFIMFVCMFRLVIGNTT